MVLTIHNNFIDIFQSRIVDTMEASSSSEDDDKKKEPLPTGKSCDNESHSSSGTTNATSLTSMKRAATRIIEPSKMDVMLGRGRWNVLHPGNRRLQIIINIHLERYKQARTRKAKTKITHEVVFAIKNCGSEPGRFVQYDDPKQAWFEVNDDVARLKVAQAFRYTIRSSTDNAVTDSMLLDFDQQFEGLHDIGDKGNSAAFGGVAQSTSNSTTTSTSKTPNSAQLPLHLAMDEPLLTSSMFPPLTGSTDIRGTPQVAAGRMAVLSSGLRPFLPRYQPAQGQHVSGNTAPQPLDSPSTGQNLSRLYPSFYQNMPEHLRYDPMTATTSAAPTTAPAPTTMQTSNDVGEIISDSEILDYLRTTTDKNYNKE